jgi:hypothetical protein
MCGASWMRTPVGVFLNVQQCAAVQRLWHNDVSSATCRAVPPDPKTMSVIDPVTHRPLAGQRGHVVRSHIGITTLFPDDSTPAESTPGVPALADGCKPQRGHSDGWTSE